jgi:hypothetical protein
MSKLSVMNFMSARNISNIYNDIYNIKNTAQLIVDVIGPNEHKNAKKTYDIPQYASYKPKNIGYSYDFDHATKNVE